jgi:O-antigen ligase
MELSEKQSPTSILVAGVCLFVPLLILPASVSYSFDSFPRAAYLLLSAAIFLLLPDGFARTVGNLLSTTAGKLFLIFAAIGAISLIASSLSSVDPQLSFFGTRWRYFGTVSQLAALAIGIAAAGCFTVHRAALFFSLRMISLAGLIAAVYALLQFFGIDPLLAPGLYTLTFNITRPPSSLGHPGYLAGFETIVFFAALAARQAEKRCPWRFVLAACAGFALIAIFVSGTRAAVIAVVLCFPVFFAIRKVRGLRGWTPWVLLVLSVAVFGLLMLVPQGRGLRQRVRQATQDFGGPRLLVWKDTLELLGSRAFIGSGPETFTVVFPKVESRELYLRYPDFQQESPHNVFLDAAVAQGIPGLLELLFAVTLAGWCAWKTEEANRDVAYILCAGVAACVIFHQFFAFTLPTYCGFLFLMSALVALSAPSNLRKLELPPWGRVTLALSGTLLAVVLFASAAQLGFTDYAFARTDALLKHGDLADAVEQYHFARRWKFFGDSPDLWYSQQMAWAVGAVPAGELQQLARAEALEASRIAFENPGEDRVTAAYHRAILCASSGQQQQAENAARRLSLEAPNWYQPHWILSRLLVAGGHLEEGERESELALALVGDNEAELRQKMKLYQQVVLLAEKKRPSN